MRKGSFVFTILMFLLASTVPTSAQELYIPIFITNSVLINIMWSSDSSSLTFQEIKYASDGAPAIGPRSTHWNNWYSYNVDQGTLTQSSLWPLPQVLAQGLPIGVTTYPPIASLNAFTFLSPDNRFLIYPAVKPDGWNRYCWPIGLVDTERSVATLVPIAETCGLEDFDTFFTVEWSDTGNAFTIHTFTGFADTRTYYVNNYSDTLEAISVVQLDDMFLSSITVFDVCPIESCILLMTGITVDEYQLLVRGINTTQVQLVAQGTSKSFIEAAFSPDQRYVWYVSEDGLIQYDLESSKSTVLEPAINSTWIDRAWISPNGKHIAWVAKAKGGNSYGVYVEPMTEQP
ncbi:MAG: hypothetical protein HZC41_02200 [Chloroflexi bacterium]|nr:hypothetical protein [Chloroflexota bacterium]